MVRINSFRFLEQITVRDTTTKQIWHFICNNWLIPSKGLDVAKYKLVQMKKLPYKYTLRVKSLQTLRDRHLWLSVYVCPRHSTFTRVQRLSCCFQFIMCAMLVNIMFYDIHMNQLQEDLLHEVFNFNLSHVIVGAQSALILFPISMLTAAIFRMASQHDMFDVRFGDKNDSSSYSSSEITGDEDSCAYITDEDMHGQSKNANHNVDDNGINNDSNTSTISDEIHSSRDGEASYYDERTTTPNHFRLPCWCVYIGWALAMSSCAVSSYVVLMYGLTFGMNRSLDWISSFLASVTNNIGLLQPVKVACLVFTMTLFFNSPVEPIADITPRVDIGRSLACRKVSIYYIIMHGYQICSTYGLNAHTHTHTHTYIYIYMHVYRHIYIYMHAYTYVIIYIYI